MSDQANQPTSEPAANDILTVLSKAQGQQGNTPAPSQNATPAPAQPQTQQGGDAPVTRAEFQALLAKLDGLTAPKPEAKPEPKEEPTSMPKWAKEMGLDQLAGTIKTLAQTQAQATLAGKRQALQAAVLADVPEANKALAQLALEGLITSSGIDLSTADVAKVAPQLATALREQVGQALFTTTGSKFSAIPSKGNGEFDWSHVNSLEEVPPGMISKIPADVWRRLNGGEASQTGTQGTSWRPGNRAMNVRSQ